MLGLSLTGGGARGAYQAGVTLALGEIFKEQKIDYPFSCYSGVSAGSINAVYLAAFEKEFPEGAKQLANLWSHIQAKQIYRTDTLSLGRIGASWIRDLSFGNIFQNKKAHELLDAKPLLKLLKDNINYESLKKNISEGYVQGVSCTAFSYKEQKSIAFIQGHANIEMWERSKRYSKRVELSNHHVLASCAIPLIFSPISIDGTYYGDGMLRNTAPISPMIHMGCRHIIMVGARYPGVRERQESQRPPSAAVVFGTILNSLFFDNVDTDLERLQYVNELVVSHELNSDHAPEVIECLYIRPTKDLSKIAKDIGKTGLPALIEYLLGGLGNKEETAELASYLLFHPSYTKTLVGLGYEDTLARKEGIIEFYDKSQANRS